MRLSQTICPPVSFISVHLRPALLNQKINPAPKGREQFPRYHPFSPASRDALSGRQHALVLDNGRRPRSVLLAPTGGTFFWRLGSYLQGVVPRLLPPYQTRWVDVSPLLLSVLAFVPSNAHSFRVKFTLSQSCVCVNSRERIRVVAETTGKGRFANRPYRHGSPLPCLCGRGSRRDGGGRSCVRG